MIPNWKVDQTIPVLWVEDVREEPMGIVQAQLAEWSASSCQALRIIKRIPLFFGEVHPFPLVSAPPPANQIETEIWANFGYLPVRANPIVVV